MQTTFSARSLLRRHIALPADHGAWVFLFSPLVIGLAAGGWRPASPLLVVAALAAFLLRQPVSIIVKVYSGRRPQDELAPAWFWAGLYGGIAAVCLAGLALSGAVYLLYLALPALPVFAWHLYLVSRRSERRALAVELAGSGVLALAAPAAYWLGAGSPDARGWLLWLLAWLQSAASIVYAYLRLEQRAFSLPLSLADRLRPARRALAYSLFNVLFAAGLAAAGQAAPWLVLPFGLQLAETIYGTLRPAAGVKPVLIGMRQLAVSSLFTLLFILTWR